jgi:Tetratricopeptide repeat.
VKFNIGTIYLALKNPVDALDYFKQAQKLKPDEPRYQEAVQRLSTNLGREQQTRMASEQAWNQQEGGNSQNNNGGRGKKIKTAINNSSSLIPISNRSLIPINNKIMPRSLAATISTHGVIHHPAQPSAYWPEAVMTEWKSPPLVSGQKHLARDC